MYKERRSVYSGWGERLSAPVMALALVACSSPGVKVNGQGTGGAGSGGTGGGGASGSGLPPVVAFPDAGTIEPGRADAGGGSGMGQGGVTRPCSGLECRQTSCVMGDCKQPVCTSGAKTTLTGRVFDPAGKTPLYNAIVYVPNAELAPIAEGVSCDRCGGVLSGKPIASAITDVKGAFVLENVPTGANVPVVVQIGKWRRQMMLPAVNGCMDNAVADGTLRLPRNRSEGHIPKIALTTGGADKLECLLRKMGLDDAEFTPEGGEGRINFFQGVGGSSRFVPTLNAGAAFRAAETLWSPPTARLDQYDMVILSCEGGQHPQTKSVASRQALQDYADKGGRVFASHWHNVWIEQGVGMWPQVASFIRANDLVTPFVSDIDTSFPKGAALAEWLVNVAAQAPAKLEIFDGQHTVASVDAALARSWIFSNNAMHRGRPDTPPESVQYFTFNTPVGSEAGKECGRVVFTDIHVSTGDRAGVAFPSGCTTAELSAQEKALMFMLFDLSSCVMRDEEPPRPPVIQ